MSEASLQKASTCSALRLRTCSFLTATIVLRTTALNTSPYEPVPIGPLS